MGSCKAVTTDGHLWTFCPSIAASVLFTVLFVGTFLAHCVQAIRYRRPYCLAIIISALWQVLAYFFHTVSIVKPASLGAYALWFIFLLTAPLWTNAFAYMVFGRMVWNYADKGKIWGFKAWMFGLVFVLLDILAFLIQVWGAARTTGRNVPASTVLQGFHIYMGGVGIQLFFILIFCVFASRLYGDIRKSVANHKVHQSVMHLFYAEMFAVVLIAVRIIYRLSEYAEGSHSSIPTHEVYQYVLDSVPMLVALVGFNVVHPGRIMRGKEYDMPPAWKQGRRYREMEMQEMQAVSKLGRWY